MKHTKAILVALLGAACSRQPALPEVEPVPAATSAPAIPDGARWLLEGTTDERFVRVARQLRGFDMAMAETGYRYAELHWAGQDRNWDYATYQLDKIGSAIANGVERRPLRATSAKMIEPPIAALRRAIGERDGPAFDDAFASLTTTCNACHQAERVPFIRVSAPTLRTSVTRGPEDAAP